MKYQAWNGFWNNTNLPIRPNTQQCGIPGINCQRIQILTLSTKNMRMLPQGVSVLPSMILSSHALYNPNPHFILSFSKFFRSANKIFNLRLYHATILSGS